MAVSCLLSVFETCVFVEALSSLSFSRSQRSRWRKPHRGDPVWMFQDGFGRILNTPPDSEKSAESSPADFLPGELPGQGDFIQVY